MVEDLLLAAPSPQRTAGTRDDKGLSRWDVLLPASLAFWAIGVSQTDTSQLGQFGLTAALPIVFYMGIGLLVISIGWALAQAQPSSFRLTAHLGCLVLMLYGTAPLVYSEGRYAWLYKYIGVVQYIKLHGHLNERIDIFQNWPGFFALTAWFDKVAGVQSAVAYAKWAQLAFELLSCLILSFVFRALPLTIRERWLALFLYASSIWIAQDYLSAQALGVVLSAGVFALVLHFMYQEREALWVTWLRERLQPPTRVIRRTGDNADELDPLEISKASRAQDVAILVTICSVYFVLVFEHELTPYVVLIQLVGLAVIGRIRHRWFVAVLAAIAFGYLAPHFTYVNKNYGLLASMGNFFSNATPPLTTLGKFKVATGVTLAAHAARLLSVGMWGLSGVGAWRRWRSRRPTLPLVILAYSPALVFFAGAYGNEGLLRVYLFSLPWTACLAASALKPVGFSRSRLGAVGVPVALLVVIALFIPSFFGDDFSYVMPRSEVRGVLAFYQSAHAGTIFAADDNFPAQINGRYELFPEQILYGQGAVLSGSGTSAAEITRAVVASNTKPDEPAYILIASSMQAYGTEFGFLGPHELQNLTKTLNDAPGWSRIYNTQDLTIFELPPSPS
jgi:hypothetical protein